LTIAASTIISAINAMTMAPARAVTLIKPHVHGEESHREALPRWGIALLIGYLVYRIAGPLVLAMFGLSSPGSGHGAEAAEEPVHSIVALWSVRLLLVAAGSALGWFIAPPVNGALNKFLGGFNWVFDRLAGGYGFLVRGLLRVSFILLLVYGGLLAMTGLGFKVVPKGFIPDQDKGYLVVNVQLPDGASLERTDRLVTELSKIARETEGIAHVIAVPGYSTLLSTNISNVGGMFVILAPFEERKEHPELHSQRIAAELRRKYDAFQEATVGVFGAPPVEGLGSTGGIKLQIQDKRDAGLRALQGAVQATADEGQRQPGIAALFSTFSVNQPQIFVEIDREKAKAQSVSLDDVNNTLQSYLGSFYVNDFTFQNRNWQVNVQADPKYRMRVEDIGRLEVRNAKGDRVPLATLIHVRNTSGPAIVNHYNLYPSAEITGILMPGVSSRQGIDIMDRVARDQLPSTMGYEWTELSFQELLAEKDLLAKLVFPLAVLFVFMVLAAQYESWSLPMAILLIVPMCVLSALVGLWMVHLDNNIFAQIGFVVLIGLAAKNAILVVEFAKQLEDAGQSRLEAVVEASRTRLRPILMTAFAFILGVVPLAVAKGAGAEMRVPLGIAVFSGMLGVTFFGLIFTPVFYWIIMRFAGKERSGQLQPSAAHEEERP
jgi:hydrophobe/amphiphile efflux-1 (HAE1) family protein